MNVVDTGDSGNGASKTVKGDRGRDSLQQDEGRGLGCEARRVSVRRRQAARQLYAPRGRALEKMMQVMTNDTAGSLYILHE